MPDIVIDKKSKIDLVKTNGLQANVVIMYKVHVLALRPPILRRLLVIAIL